MRNHEYYHDPTAGTAIKRTFSRNERHKGPLTFRIGELLAWKRCRKELRRSYEKA